MVNVIQLFLRFRFHRQPSWKVSEVSILQTTPPVSNISSLLTSLTQKMWK